MIFGPSGRPESYYLFLVLGFLCLQAISLETSQQQTPAFSGRASCFTHYFADYNLLSFIMWLQDHSLVSPHTLPSLCQWSHPSWLPLPCSFWEQDILAHATFCYFSSGFPPDIPFLLLGCSSLPHTSSLCTGESSACRGASTGWIQTVSVNTLRQFSHVINTPHVMLKSD